MLSTPRDSRRGAPDNWRFVEAPPSQAPWTPWTPWTMATRVELDSISMDARLGCGTAGREGLRSATLTMVGPRWASVRIATGLPRFTACPPGRQRFRQNTVGNWRLFQSSPQLVLMSDRRSKRPTDWRATKSPTLAEANVYSYLAPVSDAPWWARMLQNIVGHLTDSLPGFHCRK